MRQFSSMPWVEVIGVVEDVRHNGVDEDAPAIVYWPAMQEDLYTLATDDSRATLGELRYSEAHVPGNESFLT